MTRAVTRAAAAAAALVGCALALLSCATSAATRAAKAGDYAALRVLLVARERKGDLSNAEAADIARAVAERMLTEAAGSFAVEIVREARSCARQLDGALAARASRHDDAGAEAALERLDAGALSPDDARRWVDDGAAPWRAVGARGLTRAEDAARRARALLDPAPEVRRAAARAAGWARATKDLALLFEAARVDPDAWVRTEAVRAIASQPPEPAEHVADRLRDLWTSGDDGLREDIARAYAAPAVWDFGGRDALRVLVSRDEGPGGVDAAAMVLGRHTSDPALARDAAAALARAIAGAPRPERLQALAVAPLEPVLLEAARAAARDDDAQVRVAALTRLLEWREPSARETLVGLAAPASTVARRARDALAAAGDRSIQAWVERDLVAPSPDDRVAAARTLAAMHREGRAAPLLADGDARVRMRVACLLLVSR